MVQISGTNYLLILGPLQHLCPHTPTINNRVSDEAK